mmetsp:Transcript_19331/g.66674  ORF Transcript_19331/g.66674 Transcript_19331/m.66674 type:complete len:303 (-) Transcript_19331:289-1197(-)
MVARLLELPEGIVAKADVVRRDVVRADVHRRDVVELERLLIVPDAVVEAADLEGDVLGSVQREVVGPDARQVSAQIIPQFLAAGRHLVQNHVPELVKHVRVPVAQLEQRHDGFQGRGLCGIKSTKSGWATRNPQRRHERAASRPGGRPGGRGRRTSGLWQYRGGSAGRLEGRRIVSRPVSAVFGAVQKPRWGRSKAASRISTAPRGPGRPSQAASMAVGEAVSSSSRYFISGPSKRTVKGLVKKASLQACPGAVERGSLAMVLDLERAAVQAVSRVSRGRLRERRGDADSRGVVERAVKRPS